MKRPSKYNGKDWDSRLNIYVSKEMKEFVNQQADRNEVTDSGYVRQLIKAEMNKHA